MGVARPDGPRGRPASAGACHDDRDRPTAARGGGGTSACGAHHVGRTPPAATARHNVPYRHTGVWTEYIGMGRPRLYATSVERKAAWRRRHGMAVRPHYPSAAAKQAAYRARKRQAAQDLAARECAAIQQALQTRALADQCWELHELHRRLEPGRGHAAPWCRRAAPPGSWPARAPAFMGWPRRACAGIGGRSSAWRTSGPPEEPAWARRATRTQTAHRGVRLSPATRTVRESR